MRSRRVLATALASFLALTACSATAPRGTQGTSGLGPAIIVDDHPSPDLNGTLLDPPAPRPTQILPDTSGEPFSIADRPTDELTILFFGYTHCPDVCPTTVADLASARGQLTVSLRERVTVVFVTEDPERDTPRALRRWLDGFDPSFVGLRGGNRATANMLEHLHLPQTERSERPQDPITHHPDSASAHHRHGTYGAEHAGVVYAFGPGDSTVIYSGGTTPPEYAADFTGLLTGTAIP